MSHSDVQTKVASPFADRADTLGRKRWWYLDWSIAKDLFTYHDLWSGELLSM
jgi:hypothetical protein